MAGFVRARNRLDPACYAGRQSYFVTTCIEGRKPILAEAERVTALLDLLLEVCLKREFQIYAYCFMPDHLHLEPVGCSDRSSLPILMRDFKGRATAVLRKIGVRDLWQKGFYDHINRAGELESIAAYVFENPVRAGLVKNIYEWPYSGSFLFDWRKFAPPAQVFVPPWKKLL